MKTKPADKLYCGVNPDKIKNAKPVLNEENFKHLYTFIVKRYMIHIHKDVKKRPAPWTDDPILQEYKFTNVRREHDRETLWVLNNIVNNETLSYNEKIMNLILYRMFNKSETMEIFGSVIYFEKPYSIDVFIKRLKRYAQENPKYSFFTNAFLTVGIKVALGQKKETNDEFHPARILKFAELMWSDGVVNKINKAKDQREVFNILKSYHGLGEFLAYQIFVDFTYIPEFPFSENEFTVAGPGCMRGLKQVFADFGGLNFEEALFWLRDNINHEFAKRDFEFDRDAIFSDLDKEDRYMNVMSLENCHCEISKYIKAVTGTGRPRNKYRGGKG